MATTKTLTPTNQAITISAFTEKPDNRINANNDDKLADAVNTLNSNKMNSTIGSSLQSVDILAQAPGAYRYNGNCSNIPSSEAGFLQIVERDSTTKVATAISNSGRTFSNAMIGGTWIGWKELAMASDLIKSHGTIAQNITYEKVGNIITVFINGVSVTAQSSWTLLADLPSDLAVRYSVHFKSMDGVDIQISGQTIKYRGSASSIFGAITYIAMT